MQLSSADLRSLHELLISGLYGHKVLDCLSCALSRSIVVVHRMVQTSLHRMLTYGAWLDAKVSHCSPTVEDKGGVEPPLVWACLESHRGSMNLVRDMLSEDGGLGTERGRSV
jgi:hypothetical protein